MEWVTEVANISALYVYHVISRFLLSCINFYCFLPFMFRRLCRSQIVLESVESFHFRGPSYMGERVSLNSSVNKVFSNKRYKSCKKF